jgi:tRNA A-37 threonylcarbamoyl transferase component Bud32
MNTLAIKNPCPNCGQPLPEGAALGLCPKCLLAGVAAATEAVPPIPEPSAPPIEIVRTAFPKLEIIDMIGMGGMGVVYKARQPQLDRLVALKLLPASLAADPAFTERFNREARLLARLNHPNIVAVYDFGQTGGFFFLMMEFVDGVNLRQAMAAGRFTPAQALEVVPKVCEALQFAHEEGILHRDIKPENILLDAKGRVKIADFGIAKLVGDRKEATLTASKLAVGTPHYMAPEQFERPQEVDQRADIYSLGVVFYEMLTGELPIGRFAPPSHKSPVDSHVDEAVLRALEKERERRYRSASEMKTRVEGLSTGTGAPSAPLIQESPESSNAKWSKKAVAGVVMAGLSLPILCLLGIPMGLWLLAGMRGGIGGMEIIMLAVFGLVAAGLLVGASILGSIALSDIRRSAGVLRGRGFAVCAALCGPLLLVSGMLLFLIFFLAAHVAPNALPGTQLVVLPLSVLLIFVLDTYVASFAWRWAGGPGGRARFGMLLALIPCGMMAITVPALIVFVTIWLPALMKARTGSPGAPAAASHAAKSGYEVDFTLPPNQVAVFEVVARTNRALVPLPELGMYWVNSSDQPGAGTFVWADNPNDRGLDGRPRWRFGIISTNGNTLAEGLGVPRPPPGFSSTIDAWVALQANDEKVLGLPPGDASRPGYGLRIRTLPVDPQPGVRRQATGFGTNWVEMMAENPSPRR